MTTSASIAAYMKPLGMVSRGSDWPYGKKKVYAIDELIFKKKKKKKLYYGEIGMMPITMGESDRKAE